MLVIVVSGTDRIWASSDIVADSREPRTSIRNISLIVKSALLEAK
jgi:hypothetical protein